jgi:outer membrane protein assembly factor BamB
MISLKRTMLPGQVWGLAAPSAGGPIIAACYNGSDLYTTVVTAVDLDGTVLWNRQLPGHPIRPRLSTDGTVWIAHRDQDGAVLTELNAADGTTLRSFTPEHEPFEHLGAFVVLPDGVCASWASPDRPAR